jgi:hypothetical protein
MTTVNRTAALDRDMATLRRVLDNPTLRADFERAYREIYGVRLTPAQPAAPPPAQPAPPAPLSAWETIQTLARERAAKDGSTFEQAVVRVLADDPSLYDRYLREPPPAPVQKPAPPPPAPPATWGVIEGKARALATAEGITVEQATVRVLEGEPALYATYAAELKRR